MRRLLIDLDGTVVDVHRRAVERGHFDIHPPCRWSMSCCTTRHINEIFEDDDVFRADPLPGAIEGVRALMVDFDVHFVSTPWHSNHNSARIKYEWVEEYFGDARLLTLTHDKSLVAGLALIDDKPGLTGPWHHIAYPQPWNDSRHPTWEDGLAIHVRRILGGGEAGAVTLSES